MMKADQRDTLPRPAVERLILVQMLAGMAPLAILVPMGMQVAAISAAWGTVLAVVPNWIFARWAFRHTGARHAQRVVADFYFGETLKFFATVVGFGVVFALIRPLAAGWLFLSYLLALAVYWFAPARMARRGTV